MLRQARRRTPRNQRGALPALQERSREKRDRLLLAGLRVFGELGYDEARVADIAREAHISVGAFYQRFKDKRALFDALESEFVNRGVANSERFFASADPDWSPTETFERLIRNIGRVMRRNVGFFRALVSLGHTDPSVVAPGVDLDRRTATLLHDFLTTRGWLRPGIDAEHVYFGLASVTKILAMMALTGAGPYRPDSEKTARELARMLQRYIDL